MKSIELPSLAHLNKLLYINDNYQLVHKKKCGAKEGSLAGNHMPSGYIRINTGGKLYLAHRIIFKMHYLIDPIGKEVDHIDRNKRNNNPLNLRLASKSENRKNTDMYMNNSTGYKVVWKKSADNKFYCAVQSNKKRVQFGPFSTPEEASKKYNQVAKTKFAEFYVKSGV